MAKLSRSKKALSLTVKAVYDAPTDSFILLQDDKDLKNLPFRITVNPRTFTHSTLLDAARAKGMMLGETRTGDGYLPNYVEYPTSPELNFDQVPVGVSADGKTISISLREHVFVSGPTGSGKTVLLNSIVYGVTELGWTVHLFDPADAVWKDSPNVKKYSSSENFTREVLDSISMNVNGRHMIVVDQGVIDEAEFLDLIEVANQISYARVVVSSQLRMGLFSLSGTEVNFTQSLEEKFRGRARSAHVLVGGNRVSGAVNFQCYAFLRPGRSFTSN